MAIKTVFVLFISALFASSSFATIWRVDSNPGNTGADFTTLQSAHNGAVAGDTLYVVGSSIGYGALNLTKRLVVIGPGYFLAQNPQTQANTASAKISSTLTFSSGSQGSFLSGFDIDGQCFVNASNITLKRNSFDNNFGNNYLILTDTGVSNLILTQSYLRNVGGGGDCLTVGASNTNIIVTNCWMQAVDLANHTISSPASSDMQVINNVLRGTVTIDESVFDNNIIREASFISASNSTVRNNMCNATQLPAGNGNQLNVLMTDVFELTGSADGQWQLKVGSPAIGAGVGGEDLGMFGGPDPYVLSGVPSIPAIYFFTAPNSGSSGAGLPVHVKIKSNN